MGGRITTGAVNLGKLARSTKSADTGKKIVLGAKGSSAEPVTLGAKQKPPIPPKPSGLLSKFSAYQGTGMRAGTPHSPPSGFIADRLAKQDISKAIREAGITGKKDAKASAPPLPAKASNKAKETGTGRVKTNSSTSKQSSPQPSTSAKSHKSKTSDTAKLPTGPVLKSILKGSKTSTVEATALVKPAFSGSVTPEPSAHLGQAKGVQFKEGGVKFDEKVSVATSVPFFRETAGGQMEGAKREIKSAKKALEKFRALGSESMGSKGLSYLTRAKEKADSAITTAEEAAKLTQLDTPERAAAAQLFKEGLELRVEVLKTINLAMSRMTKKDD